MIIQSRPRIGANAEEYDAIFKTIGFFADLQNDIENLNVKFDINVTVAIDNVQHFLNYLFYEEGIDCVE